MKKILFFCMAMFLTSFVIASEDSVVIEESDFQQLSEELKNNSLGLLVMFHSEFCHYCALMDSDILSPMVKSGEYDNKILIRKLQFDEARDIKDFSGNVMEPSDFAAKYGVSLTPTLIFLDSDGNERVPKTVGINTVEFFGAYLDEKIELLHNQISAGTKIVSLRPKLRE